MNPGPSIGRIVHYRLSAQDVQRIYASQQGANPLHGIGNPAAPGDDFPAVVVRVWNPTSVNLQVLLDGPDNLWVTSATEGEQQGNWFWPPRV